MARKLKVFQARIGFYDTVVAAPSQAAALRAWGTHLNLFADGMAHLATDEGAIAAALAQPEVALRRGLGTDAPFSLNPGPPRLVDEGQPATRRPRLRLVPTAPPPAPPSPDRSALAAAEEALGRTTLERGHEEDGLRERRAALDRDEEELRRRRVALDGEEASARRRGDVAQRRAEQAVARERTLYVKAGGDPDAERS